MFHQFQNCELREIPHTRHFYDYPLGKQTLSYIARLETIASTIAVLDEDITSWKFHGYDVQDKQEFGELCAEFDALIREYNRVMEDYLDYLNPVNDGPDDE